MFKKGFKIIVIRDGQFELREFHIKPYALPMIMAGLLVPFIAFYLILSSFNFFNSSNYQDIVNSQSETIEKLELKNKNAGRKNK